MQLTCGSLSDGVDVSDAGGALLWLAHGIIQTSTATANVMQTNWRCEIVAMTEPDEPMHEANFHLIRILTRKTVVREQANERSELSFHRD